MNKKILIAGTRLTGETPHIGTYYGWIYQIKRAQKKYNVIIMIADYQSLDNEYDESYYETALKLKKILKHFLPNVPVIIESQITNILELGFMIQNNFRKRYYNRVMPIRKQIEEIEATKFHVLLYPSLMVADVLALSASAVFDKPEGKFQHSEILNDVIADINKRYSFKIPKLELFKKQYINILSLDGLGPMKRNRSEHGIIEVFKVSKEKICEELNSAPDVVIKSISSSIEYHSLDLESDREKFISSFSEKIYNDINETDEQQIYDETKMINQINKNVNAYIKGMRDIND